MNLTGRVGQLCVEEVCAVAARVAANDTHKAAAPIANRRCVIMTVSSEFAPRFAAVGLLPP
jgi:hypothetical protein